MHDWVEEAYQLHADKLYRYAVMLLGDPAAAADVVQRVFVSLLTRRRNISSVAPYLRAAVRNECFRILKVRQQCDGEYQQILECQSELDQPVLRLAIERAVLALPSSQREVIHLKIFEGFTFDEIASITQTSINTVASRYRYALAKLREQLS